MEMENKYQIPIIPPKRERDANGRVLFTKQMKEEFTVLAPMMLPVHFGLFKPLFQHHGYNMVLLDSTGPEIAQTGLKYVHNDTCYPALLVIGQLIHALQSGKYDVTKTALVITQTGGGCRASNYIHLLRKALKKAGLEFVPVISLNLSGMEKNPGFGLTLPLIRQLLAGMIYGDALMLLRNQTAPYEVNRGDSEALLQKWSEKLVALMAKGKGCGQRDMRRLLPQMVADFAAIPVNRVPKVKVGVVGEIYVKYAALGNNGLEAFLASQDCEVNVPGVADFMLFKVDNRLEDIRLYGGSKAKYVVVNILFQYIGKMQQILIDAISTQPCYVAPKPYSHLKELVKGVVGYGSKMGEGWLLTAEMLDLAENGYENIVCTQPFGCLPNHINGKGMVRRITEIFENANIVPIDYDPGATRVNQENRIKLMLSIGRERLAQTPMTLPGFAQDADFAAYDAQQQAEVL